MKNLSILRDERTITVENASYRWGYQVLSFGLLLLITVRAFFFNQSNWDLFGLVLVSSLVATAYQAAHHIFTRRYIYLFAVLIAISALTAVVVVLLTK